MRSTKLLASLLSLTFVPALACDSETDRGYPEDQKTKGGLGKADASAEAIFLDFEWDGELLASSSFNAHGTIEDQLLYTIGHLNWEDSVGRLDRLELSNIQTSSAGNGKVRISYHAKMPVAWGHKDDVPGSYSFELPKDVSFGGTEQFTESYKDSCVDFGQAHDVTSGSMWYYYRPQAGPCNLAESDIVLLDVDVSVSDINTTGKFPEYDKVWQDDVLEVVAVFGKYEDGATSNGDAGIAAYNRFTRNIKNELNGLPLETTPSSVPSSPGVDMPEVVYEATLPDGKRVEVVAMLVDNVRTAGSSFNNRYEELSRTADLIAYNGHAGLGANIRALARKGDWVTGQYAIVFMNGCDTYAYVDSALWDEHSAVNPDDPKGTKYLDVVTNAMPSFFHSTANATMSIIRGLMDHESPRTYEQIFADIDSRQVVLVSGEQDNTFVPGGGGGGDFEPLHVVDSVARGEELQFQSGTAPAGTYVAKLAHDPANPGGDADLYVRVGSAPTENQWDCRPFINGSTEECRIELSSASEIFIGVVGWADTDNHFVLTLEREGGDNPPPVEWDGMDESGTVAADEEHRFETPVLAAGTYLFEMEGDNDADLYVRIGTAPTTELFDCRPFKTGSNETCKVDLASNAPLHVMVRGWDASSSYHLVGRAL